MNSKLMFTFILLYFVLIQIGFGQDEEIGSYKNSAIQIDQQRLEYFKRIKADPEDIQYTKISMIKNQLIKMVVQEVVSQIKLNLGGKEEEIKKLAEYYFTISGASALTADQTKEWLEKERTALKELKKCYQESQDVSAEYLELAKQYKTIGEIDERMNHLEKIPSHLAMYYENAIHGYRYIQAAQKLNPKLATIPDKKELTALLSQPGFSNVKKQNIDFQRNHIALKRSENVFLLYIQELFNSGEIKIADKEEEGLFKKRISSEIEMFKKYYIKS